MTYYHKEYYQKNKERYKEIDITRDKNNPEKYLWERAKYRSKNKGLDFDILPEDIHIPDICPIVGFKLGEIRSGGNVRPETPTLDRKNNNLGYVKGNVFVISYKGNQRKGDLTLDICERLYDYLST